MSCMFPAVCTAASNTRFHGSQRPRNQACRALNNKHKSDGYRIIIICVVKSKVDSCRYLLRSILVDTRGQWLSITSRFHGPSRAITITGFTVTQPSYPWKQGQERDGLAFQWQAPSWMLGPTGRNETLPCEA